MFKNIFSALIVCAGLWSCSSPRTEIVEEKSLKEAFAGKFLMGVAVNHDQVYGVDSLGSASAVRHFNSIVSEDDMKCENIHPEENVYFWDDADRFVEFGEKNGMFIIGHCLVWHSQCAPWFCVDNEGNLVDKETLRQRLRDHIHTIVGRYKGRINGWDVVNEAILDDGTYRQSPFYQILGEEYIPLAFQYAHEADPEAELYLNDFGMSSKGRRDAYVKLVNDLKSKGLRVDAIGMQAHIGMDYPDFRDFESAVEAFASTGCKVMITELDMSALPTVNKGANVSETVEMEDGMNPYGDQLPDSLAEMWNSRMAQVFDIMVRHSDDISRVCAWGVSDGDSWKNNWPVKGRHDYPLLLDRAYNLKPFLKEYTSPKKAYFSSFDYVPQVADGLEATDSPANPLIPGCHPDPSIVRVGEDYYLVNSSFSYFPGVPIWHSTDLKNWEKLGFVLNRPSQLKLSAGMGIREGIYAPDISYNPNNETFYMITTLVGNGGTFYVTCKDPKEGNWSDPVWLPEVGGIDPSILFDNDGKAYIVNNDGPEGKPRYDGHRAIYAREFDWKNNRVAGEQLCILDAGIHPEDNPIWIEGPHLYHFNDKYYLMCAEGGTGPDHREVILSSSSPLGGFTPCKINPILKAPSADKFPVTCTGHADLVTTADGDWFAVFLGVRPYSDGHDICGRETFILPVKWIDDQPVVDGGDRTVSYAANTSRNQTLWNVDGFTNDAFFIRNPRLDRFSVDNGSLAVTASRTSIADFNSPAAVGCWATENAFSANASLDRFDGSEEGDFAGMVIFQDDNRHILFGKSIDAEGKPCVRLAAYRKDVPAEIADFPLARPDEKLNLQVSTAGDGVYSFAYASGKDKMTEVPNKINADFLSSKSSGNFTGTMVGLYATADYK